MRRARSRAAGTADRVVTTAAVGVGQPPQPAPVVEGLGRGEDRHHEVAGRMAGGGRADHRPGQGATGLPVAGDLDRTRRDQVEQQRQAGHLPVGGEQPVQRRPSRPGRAPRPHRPRAGPARRTAVATPRRTSRGGRGRQSVGAATPRSAPRPVRAARPAAGAHGGGPPAAARLPGGPARGRRRGDAGSRAATGTAAAGADCAAGRAGPRRSRASRAGSSPRRAGCGGRRPPTGSPSSRRGRPSPGSPAWVRRSTGSLRRPPSARARAAPPARSVRGRVGCLHVCSSPPATSRLGRWTGSCRVVRGACGQRPGPFRGEGRAG